MIACIPFREGRISIPCHKCGLWPVAPHVIGDLGYCAIHCPEHAPPPFEFTSPLPTGEVIGEQEELFP